MIIQYVKSEMKVEAVNQDRKFHSTSLSLTVAAENRN